MKRYLEMFVSILLVLALFAGCVPDVQQESSADSSQPESNADSSQPESNADSSQPESNADSSQPESSADSSQPESSADSSQPESSADSSQPESSADSSQPDDESSSAPLVPTTKNLLVYFDWQSLSSGKAVNKVNGKSYEVKGTSPKLVTGKEGKALYFNGTDTYINLGTDYQFSKDYTISFWIQLDAQENRDGNKQIIGRSYPGIPTDTWTTEVGKSGGLNHHFAVGSNNSNWLGHHYNDETVVTPGEWSRVTIVREKNTLSIYIDGYLAYYTTDILDENFDVAGSPLIIGGCVNDANVFDKNYAFKGALDELRIYDRALSSTELAALTGAERPLEFSKMTASEMTFTVQEKLDSVPVASDFKVSYSVEGQKSVTLPITSVKYSEEKGTLTLSYKTITNDQNKQLKLSVQAVWKTFTYKTELTLKANATVKNPKVSNVKITNITKNPELGPEPHVKSVLQASYTYSSESGFAEGKAKYQWYISNTKNGTYTKLKGIVTDTIILIDDYEGKYLKCEVSCTDIYGNESAKVMSAATTDPVAHTDGNPLTDWFYEAKYGVSHHFISDFMLMNQTGTEQWNPATETWSDVIDKFDVQEYAKQVAKTGAKFVLLTLNQNSAYFCSPSAAYDKALREAGLLGENEVNPKTPKRDLPMEIADELAKYDIKLMLYLPCHPPANASWIGGDLKVSTTVFHYNPNTDTYPKQEAMVLLHEMIREWSLRYGDKVAGWWFDGMFPSAYGNNGENYFDGWMNMNNEYNISSLANAAKAGNPDRIVTFNHGIEGYNNPYRVTTDYHDFSAGETNTLSELPSNNGRWTEDSPNAQKFLFGFIGEWWGGKGLHMSDQELIDKVTRALEKDVVVMMDINLSTSGKLDTRQADQLVALKNAKPNIAIGKTATASTEYPGGYGADKVVDGSTETRWSADTDGDYEGSKNQWLMIDLGSASKLSKVGIQYHTWDGTIQNAPLTVTIQIKKQESDAWTTVLSKADAPNNDSHEQSYVEYAIGSNYPAARYVRLLFEDGGQNNIALTEVKVYGE